MIFLYRSTKRLSDLSSFQIISECVFEWASVTRRRFRFQNGDLYFRRNASWDCSKVILPCNDDTWLICFMVSAGYHRDEINFPLIKRESHMDNLQMMKWTFSAYLRRVFLHVVQSSKCQVLLKPGSATNENHVIIRQIYLKKEK